MQIKKAIREKVWLKIAVTGATGSGKTYGAIGLAKGLSEDGRILVIDTENASAGYYAGDADSPGQWIFDTITLSAPFSPQNYMEALQAGIDAGYKVIVIDSLSHEWNASGGALDIKAQKDARGGNSFVNWGSVKQIHNKFVEMMLQSKIHLIATMRSKMEYVLEADDKGKQAPRKIGLAPISSEGMEYEFGVTFDIDRNTHLAIASKDRTGRFDNRSVLLNAEIGKELKEWRDSGAEMAPEPAPQTVQETPETPPQATKTPEPAGITLEQVQRLTELVIDHNVPINALIKYCSEMGNLLPSPDGNLSLAGLLPEAYSKLHEILSSEQRRHNLIQHLNQRIQAETAKEAEWLSKFPG